MSVKPIIIDLTARAIDRVTGITDGRLSALAEDAAKLAQQMARDKYASSPESTGALAAAMHATHKGRLKHSVVSDPSGGYGAFQEWGHYTKGKKRRIKGTHIILRAVKGMAKRHAKGGRWEEDK